VKEFMFLMQGDDSKDLSPQEMQARMGGYMQWMKKMTDEGRLKAGQPLEPSGRLLMRDQSVVTDGPFLEPTEIIGGYVIVLAADLDEATELAKGCPLLSHCDIQVRPVFDVPAP